VVIDEGWMIGWFANAIETGRNAGLASGAAISATEVADWKRWCIEAEWRIERALKELGIPGEGYPAPVANAVEILNEKGFLSTPEERESVGIES
jgi:hypothetical protein